MPTAIDRRIFVVGAPRSGTTLVQSLLASHTALTSFTESHLFSRHFRILPLVSLAVLVKNPSARLEEFLAENRLGSDHPALEVAQAEGVLRPGVPPPLQTRAVARRLLGVLDELARLQDRSSWVEKTPRHLRYVPFLARVSRPECRTHFVHVLRRGIDVVASLYLASQSWERAYDLETCVQRWNDDVGLSLRLASSPDNHLVFYEDLLADPEVSLERLLSRLELDWQPDILERFGPTASRLITEQEAWKSDIDRGVRRSADSGRTLTDVERRQATAALRSELYDRLWAETRSQGPEVGR